jgi:Undecaprenyl-phosphate glucose phosphotransferase
LLDGSFLLAHYLRFDTFFFKNTDVKYWLLLGFIDISWIILTAVTQQYTVSRGTSILKAAGSLFFVIGVQLLSVFAIWVIFKAYYFSRIHLFLTFSFSTSLLVTWRLLFFLFIQRLRMRGYNYRNVVVVGYGDAALQLKNTFQRKKEHGYKFLGFFDNRAENEDVKGKIKDIFTFCTENFVDEIYCCLPQTPYSHLKDIIDYADNNFVKVRLIPDLRGVGSKKLSISRLGGKPIIDVSLVPLDSTFNKVVKRIFDIIFASLVILLILSWVIPIIGLLIKLESKGSVFFLQRRHGRNNRVFMCWKFRTMYVNAESDQKQASKGDARITKIGAFLRKTSIDELPQFLNVLYGDMSVVGPRPHPISLNEKFYPSINKFKKRHSVKPGITGLAQSKGYRGETQQFHQMKNRVRLDLFYVENWSFLLDLKIILYTVFNILRGDKNAY